MTTMLIAGTVWFVLAGVVALVVARAVHLADERSACSSNDDLDRMPLPDDSPRVHLHSAHLHSGTELPGSRPPIGRRRAGTPVA